MLRAIARVRPTGRRSRRLAPGAGATRRRRPTRAARRAGHRSGPPACDRRRAVATGAAQPGLTAAAIRRTSGSSYPRTWTVGRGSWITALTWGRRLPYRPASARHGGDRRVTWLARGAGRPGPEPDEPRKTDRAAVPASNDDAGSGSRPVHAPTDQEARGSPPRTAPVARRGPSRTSRPRRSLPLDATASAALGLAISCRRPARRLDDHSGSSLAWNAAINLTAVRDPARSRSAHVLDSLAAVAVLRAAGDRRVRRPRQRRRLSRPAARRRAAGRAARCSSNRRQEGPVPARPRRGRDRARQASSRSSPAGPRRSPRPRHRGRWPAVIARAVGAAGRVGRARAPAPRAGRVLVAWKRERRRTARARRRRPAIAALGRRGPVESCRSSRPRAWRITGSSSSTGARRSTGPTRAIRRCAGASPGARRAGTAPRAAASGVKLCRADRRPVRHPRQPRRPRCRAGRARLGRRGLAPRRRRRLRAGPDAVVARLAAIGRDRRARQPRRGGARRRRDRLVQPRRPPRDGVDAQTIAPGDARLARRPCPSASIDGDFTLVHGSPRDPTWEYVTTLAGRAGEPRASSTTPFGLHGHTHLPSRVTATRTAASRSLSPSDGSTLALDGRPLLVNPGSVGQPRDGDPRASYLVLDPDAAERDLAPRGVRHRGRVRRRCAGASCPTAWSSGSIMASESEACARTRTGSEGRRPLPGRKPGDRRSASNGPTRRTSATPAPASWSPGRPPAGRRRRRAGPRPGARPRRSAGPLADEEEIGERLSKRKALAIFSSDAISSSAYATEEILQVLILGRRRRRCLLGRGLDRDRGPAGRRRRRQLPPGLPRLPERRRRLRRRARRTWPSCSGSSRPRRCSSTTS